MAKTEQKTQKMTEKQKKFCDFYLKHGNATQASIEAGYSEDTARNIGCENLTKPYILEYIKERSEKASNSRIMTVTDLKEFWSGTAQGLIEGADYKDRLKASELLGKAEALFVERLKHEGTISISSELNKARERGA